MNCLVVGASAGLGRALAERLARSGHHLLLVSSDARDLSAQSADLRLKYSVRVEYAALHLDSSGDWLPSLVEKGEAFGALQGLFFPVGFSSAGDLGTLGDRAAREILEANFFAVTAIVSHYLPALLKEEKGYIVGIGSIAAIRGRKSNILYSAAKRALLSYFESLQHLCASTAIKAHFYQVGYLRTQQTFGRRLLFPLCEPDRVARVICERLDRRPRIRYFPAFWGLIARVLRAVPTFLFHRMEF